MNSTISTLQRKQIDFLNKQSKFETSAFPKFYFAYCHNCCVKHKTLHSCQEVVHFILSHASHKTWIMTGKNISGQCLG